MALLMFIHVAAGAVGLLSGALALIFRKGGVRHRQAGRVFGVSMLIMAGLGAWLALFDPSRISLLVGLLTCYLVASGWMTIRRRPGTVGRFERAGLVFITAVALMALVFAVQALNSPTGELDGLPPTPAFVFAGIACLAAVLDVNFIRRGGVSGSRRVLRHLWRMCAPLLNGATAFFLGQQDLMPEAMRGSPIPLSPILVVLAVTMFWIVRTGARIRREGQTP